MKFYFAYIRNFEAVNRAIELGLMVAGGLA